MLIKLLKYDLKYMIKNMAVFYFLALFFATMTRVLHYINGALIVTIMEKICLGSMFSMLFSILINTLIRSWIRFRDSLYKDESYLTHTLPVTKNDLYNSKFIQTFIFSIIGFLVIILCLFIVYYNHDNWLKLIKLLRTITNNLNVNALLILLSLIIIIFLEIFNTIEIGFLGIILGYKKNNSKIGFSVIYGFVTYLIIQNLAVLVLFIIGLFNSNLMQLFNNDYSVLSTQLIKYLIIFSITFYFIVIGLLNFICKRQLNKGVNIE